MFLYESWTTKNSSLNLTGFRCYNIYKSYTKKRAKRANGGIVIYIRENLCKGIEIVKKHFDSIVWLKLNKTFFGLSSDVYLAAVYIWVQGSPSYNILAEDTDLFNILQTDINQFADKGRIILTGDFNARTACNADYIVCDRFNVVNDHNGYVPDIHLSRFSSDKHNNSHGTKLLELCKANSLRICNGRLGQDQGKGNFTFANQFGCSVIDYVITHHDNFKIIKSFTVLPFNEWSDHAPVAFDIDCKCLSSVTINVGARTRITWDNSKSDQFRSRLIGKLPQLNRIVDSLCASNTQSIDTGVEEFSSLIREAASPVCSKTTPVHKKITSEAFKQRLCNKSDWFDRECANAKYNYLQSVYEFNRCRNNENKDIMCSLKSVYKQLVRKKKRAYERSIIREIEQLKHCKPKDFWRLFTKNRLSTNTISAVEFFDYFCSMQSKSCKESDEESEIFCVEHDFKSNVFESQELNSRISLSEVQSAIKALKRDKASAGDDLLNEYFVESFDILASHIVDLFNAIFDSGHFPKKWSEGIIVPIHKNNDVNDVNNYRGVTLVSCFSKLFTSVINRRLNDWVGKHKVLGDSQFGFRKGRSTVDAIFVLNSVINKVLSRGKRLYCAFVDLKKAFDSVYLNGLWNKLFKLGVDSKMLSIIHDMYQQVRCCVKGQSTYSEFFECTIGLKQGEVLSPILFSMFINDLEQCLKEGSSSNLVFEDIPITTILYADDMCILADTPEELQTRLNLLYSYCNRWQLQVNTSKTKIVVFRRRGVIRQGETWKYDGTDLEVVNDFNYLGTVFNYTGSFTLNQTSLIGKGSKALNVLLYKLRNYPFSCKVLCQLFDAFVGSTLSYASEVWGFGKSKGVETIHLKFCKRILAVKASTSNVSVYGDLGRYPLYITRYVRIIKYWVKLLTTDNVLLQMVYRSLVNDCNNGISNWATSVKTLLDSFGFSHVWNYQNSGNLKSFHKIFKLRIIDAFRQQWIGDLSNCSSLNLYRSYKSSFGIETYLNTLPKMYKNIFSKFRMSSNNLRIVTGRYQNNREDRDLRLCTLCYCRDIEDEYHFLLVCPAYKDIRSQYVPPYYYNRPSVYKFAELMQLSSKGKLIDVCKCINESFKRRKTLIDNQHNQPNH